jgi:excisionase family DNA binding protein
MAAVGLSRNGPFALRTCHCGHTAPLPTSLTAAEVAARLRINPTTIYAMCRDRRMRCYRAGRSIRIPVEEIERFENQSGARDPAPRFPDIINRHF